MKKNIEMEPQEQAMKPVDTPEVTMIDKENIVKLSKPLPSGATTLVFDFDRLTGYTLIQCERNAKTLDKTMVLPSVSQTYQAFVAAAACGVKVDDIMSLSGRDFTTVLTKTTNFLFG